MEPVASGPGPTIVRVGIQGKGSSTVEDFNILASLMAEKAGIHLKAVCEDDIGRRLDWLRRGELEIVYESSHLAGRNECNESCDLEPGRGPLRLHIAASAHSGACGYMVREDSPIRTIYDISPTTRVAVCDMITERIYALLAWLGLNKKPLAAGLSDADWNADLVRFNSWEANLRSLEERRADVVCATPQNPLVKQASQGPYGVRFLELPVKTDPAGAKRFRKMFPYSDLIPAPRGEGISEIWGVTTMVGAACLWCRPDLDEEIDYRITRWLDENYALFKDRGNKLSTYTLEVLRQIADLALAPIHGGTVRYFKEKGLWTEKDQRRQEYNTRLQEWYCEAWEQAKGTAQKRGIAVSAANPAWARLWSAQKKAQHIPPIQLRSDREISAGLKRLERLGH